MIDSLRYGICSTIRKREDNIVNIAHNSHLTSLSPGQSTNGLDNLSPVNLVTPLLTIPLKYNVSELLAQLNLGKYANLFL